jgi:hypothetical protein
MLRVGRFDYVLDEDAGKDIATIVAEIRQALTDKSVTDVPVLDEHRRRMTLLLNGAAADAVVIDLNGGGPRPGEMS